jgi:hypothetical protein
MPNTRISALTASSTPLAGTEVLPVVQSSTTKQVSVANLTAGRAVATGNLTTTGTATISSNTAIGTVTPRTSANKVLLTMDAAWGGQVDIGVSGTSHAQFGSDNYDTGVSCRIQSADSIVFKMNGGTTTNIYFDTGNIRPSVAGKGINFTANTPKAGMTSQLLNWYEEGTWTPTLAASSGAITTSTITGSYTRTGNLVFVAIRVTIANNGTGLGSLNITGFPFAAKTATTISGATREDSLVGFGIVASPTSTTSINLTKYDGTYPGGSGVGFSLCLTYNM